jgi:FAD synthetase
MSSLSEDPAVRSRKYIANLAEAFRRVTIKSEDTRVKALNIGRVTDAIQRYMRDAQHYLDVGRFSTALASVAYAEGLLDALTFLELAQDSEASHFS